MTERIAVDSYRAVIQYLAEQDPTTRRMIEAILAVEKQHADELADLLVSVDDRTKGRARSDRSTQARAQ